MKNTFTLQNYLSANREVVIAEYNKLAAHQFFNGISLRDYMLKVMSYMQENNPRSDKRAESLLKSMCYRVTVANSSIGGVDYRTEALKAKYEGTAYMSLV